MLAQDEALGYSLDTPLHIQEENGCTHVLLEEPAEKTILRARIPLADGSNIPVTDYASAGKTWAEDKRIAVWLRNQ